MIDQKEITIIATTDVHGRYFPSILSEGQCSPAQASLAQVNSCVEAFRREGPVVLLDAGDFAYGGPAAYFYNHYPTEGYLPAEICRFMAYDAITPGNHDFETRFVSEPLPFLSNSATVIERGGTRVLVVGLTFPIDVAAAVALIRKAMAENEFDYLVGLFHDCDKSFEIAKTVPEFDLIVMGHEHHSIGKWTLGRTILINPGSRANSVVRFTCGKSGRSAEIIDCSKLPADVCYMERFAPEIKATREFASRVIATLREPVAVTDLFSAAQRLATGIDEAVTLPSSEILSGDVTVGDTFRFSPYDDRIATVRLSDGRLVSAPEIVGRGLGEIVKVSELGSRHFIFEALRLMGQQMPSKSEG